VKIPGIGKKTAERLLLELRDKLAKALPAVAGSVTANLPGDDRADIVNALLALGYNEKEALGAVKTCPRASACRTASARPSRGCRRRERQKLKQGFMRNVKLGSGILRLLMNLWPPFIGAGIHVENASPRTTPKPGCACAWASSTATTWAPTSAAPCTP
jgi:hypothetical protein